MPVKGNLQESFSLCPHCPSGRAWVYLRMEPFPWAASKISLQVVMWTRGQEAFEWHSQRGCTVRKAVCFPGCCPRCWHQRCSPQLPGPSGSWILFCHLFFTVVFDFIFFSLPSSGCILIALQIDPLGKKGKISFPLGSYSVCIACRCWAVRYGKPET